MMLGFPNASVTETKRLSRPVAAKGRVIAISTTWGGGRLIAMAVCLHTCWHGDQGGHCTCLGGDVPVSTYT